MPTSAHRQRQFSSSRLDQDLDGFGEVLERARDVSERQGSRPEPGRVASGCAPGRSSPSSIWSAAPLRDAMPGFEVDARHVEPRPSLEEMGALGRVVVAPRPRPTCQWRSPPPRPRPGRPRDTCAYGVVAHLCGIGGGARRAVVHRDLGDKWRRCAVTCTLRGHRPRAGARAACAEATARRRASGAPARARSGSRRRRRARTPRRAASRSPPRPPRAARRPPCPTSGCRALEAEGAAPAPPRRRARRLQPSESSESRRPDGVAHALGNPHLLDADVGHPPAVALVDRAALGEMLEHRLDEEGVALGLAVDRGGQLRRLLALERRSRSPGLEESEHVLGRQPRSRTRSKPGSRRRVVSAPRADGGGRAPCRGRCRSPAAAAFQASRQVLEQSRVGRSAQCRSSSTRMSGASFEAFTRKVVTASKSFGAIGLRVALVAPARISGRRWVTSETMRATTGPALPSCFAQRVVRTLHHVLAHGLDEGQVGDAAFGLVALAEQHLRAAQVRRTRRRAGQAASSRCRARPRASPVSRAHRAPRRRLAAPCPARACARRTAAGARRPGVGGGLRGRLAASGAFADRVDPFAHLRLRARRPRRWRLLEQLEHQRFELRAHLGVVPRGRHGPRVELLADHRDRVVAHEGRVARQASRTAWRRASRGPSSAVTSPPTACSGGM